MSDSQKTILVVEDESPIRQFLRVVLSGEGYVMIEVAAGTEAVREAARRSPDLVLLDLGLCDMDGLEVVQRLRAWSTAPIIVISARGQVSEKVAALDAGANDYLTKPFSVPELLARIRATLRLASLREERQNPVYSNRSLTVDLARCVVTFDKHELRLTPNEFKLLVILVKHAGRVLTHEQLLREVWGPKHTEDGNHLRVLMHQLRHKLEADPARPVYLQTENGVGYRLRTEP